MIKWLVPLIAVVVLGFFAFQYFGAQEADVAGALDNASTEASGAAGSAALALENAASFDPAAAKERLMASFSNMGSALNGITDVESARAALPQLESVSENLGSLSSMLDNVPETVAAPLKDVASNSMNRIQPMVDKVMGMPAVAEVLEPVIDPIMQRLNSIGG